MGATVDGHGTVGDLLVIPSLVVRLIDLHETTEKVPLP